MKEDGVDNESLSHTKWNCKYHVVFAPKYRRKIIYGKLKDTAGFMRQEGHRDNRGGGVPRPHPAVDTAEVQRVERDGVSERGRAAL